MGRKIALGAVAGFVTAALVDYQAFRAFKSVEEFASYNWGLAAFRWAQGAVSGAIAVALAEFGFSAVSA
jgi:hypothetical protein